MVNPMGPNSFVPPNRFAQQGGFALVPINTSPQAGMSPANVQLQSVLNPLNMGVTQINGFNISAQSSGIAQYNDQLIAASVAGATMDLMKKMESLMTTVVKAATKASEKKKEEDEDDEDSKSKSDSKKGFSDMSPAEMMSMIKELSGLVGKPQ